MEEVLSTDLFGHEVVRKDYRLTIKVRNNRILRAIEASGGTPGGKWCEANGLSYIGVNCLINMTDSPVRATGALTPTARKLCEVFGKLPEELWSNAQLYPLERNFSEIEMSHEQIVTLMPQEQQQYFPDLSEINNAQTKSLVAAALSTLTSLEEKVIRMRFEEDLTLAECGQRFELTPERIRQIEARAMRKLRHPARVGMYVDAIDFIDITDAERDSYKKQAAEYLEERRHA